MDFFFRSSLFSLLYDCDLTYVRIRINNKRKWQAYTKLDSKKNGTKNQLRTHLLLDLKARFFFKDKSASTRAFTSKIIIIRTYIQSSFNAWTAAVDDDYYDKFLLLIDDSDEWVSTDFSQQYFPYWNNNKNYNGE